MLVKMSWTGRRLGVIEIWIDWRAMCGDRREGVGRGRTGPRSLRAVSSRTFSMADFEGSRGRGRTMVALLPFSRSPMVCGSREVPECCGSTRYILYCSPIER